MKRGFSQSPSSSTPPPSSRFKPNPPGFPLNVVSFLLGVSSFYSDTVRDYLFQVLNLLLNIIVKLDFFCFGLGLRTSGGDSEYDEEESTKNFARKVADHYSRRTNQTLEEREASPIIHLKKLNNWVCLTPSLTLSLSSFRSSLFQ